MSRRDLRVFNLLTARAEVSIGAIGHSVHHTLQEEYSCILCGFQYVDPAEAERGVLTFCGDEGHSNVDEVGWGHDNLSRRVSEWRIYRAVTEKQYEYEEKEHEGTGHRLDLRHSAD